MTIETIWNYRKQRSMTRRACRRLHWKLTRWQWRYVVYGIPVPHDIKVNNLIAARKAVALRLLLAPSVACLSDSNNLLRILVEDAALVEPNVGSAAWLGFLAMVGSSLCDMPPRVDPRTVARMCEGAISDFWRENACAKET